MTAVLGEGWLHDRLRDAPEELRERMWEAVAADFADGQSGAMAPRQMAARLSVAAERLLGAAADGPASPETAVTLLAADGLATLACEVIAEHEPEALGREETAAPEGAVSSRAGRPGRSPITADRPRSSPMVSDRPRSSFD